MSENNVLPVILAGGKSRRFGGDKSKAKLGDLTLLDHTIQKLKKKFDEILIISNEENNKEIANVSYSKDVMEGQLGPLVGVLSSMEWILSNRKNYKWVMTFPCDTPFLPKNLIDVLLKEAIRGKHKIVIATSKEKTHPTIGIWHLSLFNDLDSSIKKGVRKILQWASRHSLGYVEFKNSEYDPFFNINYKEDILKAEEIENNFIK